ncbi:MAG: aminodeoxychorismate lyase [Gammaproteobacteria bacterium]|nr:aminodeoxychorismate lyase [Gammaproteobacteria bacterium]|tara:strand:+ start:939 stop:1769 length:831 start_codon:yes stop_codon:yes gene_type:complete
MSKTSINIFVNKKTVSSNDRGFNFGDGLFETILVQEGRPLFLQEHIQRLHKGCNILGLSKPSETIIKKNIILSIGKAKNCVIKIIYTRGNSEYGYKINNNSSPNLYFFKRIKRNKFNFNKDKKLGISNYILKPNAYLSKIKHLNRLDQIMISKELENHSRFCDMIAVDENNHIIECISSNVFFVTLKRNLNPVFYTPIIKSTGIEGIMRNKVISYLRNKKFEVKIKDILLNKIHLYDACFITNSINGITFISQIKKTKFSSYDLLYNILKQYIYST